MNNEAEVRVAEIGNQLWKWNLDVTPGEVRDQTIHREVRAGRIFGIDGGREREVTGEMEQTAEQPPLLLRAEEVAQMLCLGFTVRRALQRITGHGLQLVEPKSRRSFRTLTLPRVTVEALRQHRVGQQKEQLVAGGRWRPSGFVFTTTIGTLLDRSNVRKAFVMLLAQADLPGIRLHDLRHTCASLLLAQGVDARTIMEILGHSQVSLTLNTYSHILPSLKREAADKMDAVLGSG